MLPKNLVPEFKSKLDARYQELREEIRQELLKSDDQKFSDLAGEVHDREEESVADLLVDVDLAILDFHIAEVREIEAALIKIEQGTFGTCVDCQEDIAIERVRAKPTAKRCHSCQVRHEETHATRGTPSL